ncbi:formate dehydrogenase [Roseomonas sp. M0104]|uniref:Formate dehydrogenase n=3 Tax=Teichococcus coralli TaxID=2545983 RepID=A0A845BEC7_9PROT|nr:formate dehydrogenase [Pseudoroseomonas coralli]
MSLWDLANSDCIVVMGSNMAENHPIGFRFVVEAKQRGATVIHVDPRFTRTSALADIHAPIRSGSDIAFLGGVIRHILENDLWFRDFALNYTNIAHIIEEGYRDAEQGDGIFSGFNETSGSYKEDTWQYKGKVVPSSIAEHRVQTKGKGGGESQGMSDSPPPEDRTLQHPNCVYQIMRRHFARYTPEMVERVTGCPKETFLKVADALARNSGRERTGAFCYAVGWTHHTVGVQIIRAASIIQGLLGNVGRPGGGILALRGHVSIQGSTDIPTLYNMLPTYLPQPNIFHEHPTLEKYLEVETPETGWWHNLPKYVISLLKAWYGEESRADNEWGYQFVPKLTGDVSQLPMTLAMGNGLIKGQFMLGQNPAVGAVNSELVEMGFAKLDWMVVRDFALTETANFWKNGHRVRKGEVRPEEIGTEMFFLPTALAGEKDGSVTNTSRLVQWHDVVCEAPGDSRSDLWFIYHLGRRLKALYAGSTEPRDRGIQALTWDYPVRGARQEPDPEAVLREINGYTVADRKQLASFKEIKDDGSTACGGWMYTGVYPEEGVNKSRSRKPDKPGGSGSHANWAFAWPANRRTLYNRASADPDGKPWSERKKMIWWDAEKGEWTGTDVPDFTKDLPPGHRPDWSKHPKGMDALGGADPFIMEADGKCMLFVPSGLKDGPLPTHYEPIESPVKNPLYGRQRNPAAHLWQRPGNELHAPEDPAYPYVLTTYRLTELHCGGIISRVAPHTAELQPEAFVEIPPELARELGIRHLDWTVLATKRGEIEVRAMVTERIRPFTIGGRTVYQIGMPWVFGWEGYARGDVANVLLAITGDANTSIHTTKAITCSLRPGRVVRPPARAAE